MPSLTDDTTHFSCNMQQATRFVSNRDLVLEGLDPFLKKPDCRKQLVDILGHNGKKRRNGMSMRYLEWIATTHAREKMVHLYREPGGVPIDIHTSYKQQLARWSKMHFDPFAREEKLCLRINNTPLETSAGQLNFLRWAIETGLVAYARRKQGMLRQEITRRAAIARAQRNEGKQPKKRLRRTKPETDCSRLYVDRGGFVLKGVQCMAPNV